MKNFIILCLIFAVALIGGKFWLEYKYTAEVDELSRSISPYARANHGGVHIGIDGSITLDDISIIPSINNGSNVYIDSITLASDDRWLPLTLANSLKKGNFPDAISLTVNNFDFEPVAWSQQSKSSDACLLLETSFDNRSIGFQRLNTDFNLSMKAAREKVVLSFRSSDQTMRSRAKVTLNAKSLNPARLQSNPPTIDQIEIDATLDQQVAERAIDYCAKKLELSKQVYLDLIVGSSNFTRSLNVDLGKEGKAALVDFLQGGKELSIISKPNSVLKKAADFKFYKAEEYVRLLGLTAQIEGKNIELALSELGSIEEVINSDVKLKNPVENDSEPKLTAEQQRAIDLARGPQPTPEQEKPRYRDTSTREARKYLNSLIIVGRKNRKKPIKGKLIKVNGDSLIITTRQYGGNVVYTIDKSETASIKIFR